MANSTIISNNATNPARFNETFDFPGAASVAYNVINLDDEYSVEYDCGETLGITNVRLTHGHDQLACCLTWACLLRCMHEFVCLAYSGLL